MVDTNNFEIFNNDSLSRQFNSTVRGLNSRANFGPASQAENRATQSKINATQIDKLHEDNIAIDGLDGESSAIVRKDRAESGIGEKTKRDKINQKKKREFNQILMLINALLDDIQQSFKDIQEGIEKLYGTASNILNLINQTQYEIDLFAQNHCAVENALRNGAYRIGKDGRPENAAVRDMITRYCMRSRQSPGCNDYEIHSQISAQMTYEKRTIVPWMEAKILELGLTHDEVINMAQDMEQAQKALDEEYNAIMSMPDCEAKVESLKLISKQLNDASLELIDTVDELDVNLSNITDQKNSGERRYVEEDGINESDALGKEINLSMPIFKPLRGSPVR